MSQHGDPLQYSIFTYLWVIGLSTIGGIVSFYQKIKDRDTYDFKLVEFIGEMCTSGFVGILTFWLCEANNMSPLMTAFFVGVTGHMGSRIMFKFEKFLKNKIDSEL